ncbi:MAG: GGDEF domain-containing protein [Calditrichaceae bacterium]
MLFNLDSKSNLPKWLLIVFASIMVILIGLIDYFTGIEVSVAILYLLPVMYVVWFVNRMAAWILSLVCAIEVFLADIVYGHVYSNPFAPYWNAFVWLAFFMLLVYMLSSLRDNLEHEREISRYDTLTNVLNRKAFYEILLGEIQRSIRYNHPITLVYLDCDNFKSINDKYGHKTGDILLQMLAETIKLNIRNVDIVGRLGGDEFSLILPESNFDSANTVLTKIQRLTAAMFKRKKWKVSLSIGACTYIEPPLSADAAIQHVDKLMYKAKNEGKNKIVHRIG